MKCKNNQKPVTVGLISLGCPKNTVDSEKMLAEIAQAGLLITGDVDNADIVVINTCGFIAPAKKEAIEVINQAIKQKSKGHIKKVVAAGCLVERLGLDLFNETEGVDAIVGLGQRDKIAEIIKKTLSSNEKQVYLSHQCNTAADDRARMLITGGHWAYLRISEGCNHHCSFCTIPAIRGRFRSKQPEMILAEAHELVSAGVVELNIIAQDITAYGHDIKIQNGLAWLIKELDNIDGLRWIRLMYLYPTGINNILIDTVAQSKKILHYFDIPIQHINNEILKKMHRPDTEEQIIKLIQDLRKTIPDVILRTTLIIGFPGETDKQFDELLDFIEWAEFDALGCFRFYAESGTKAAEMAEQIPDKIKQQRVEQLMLTQQKIAFDRNKRRIGTKLSCLVESVGEDGSGIGRFYGQAPEIDSICIIKSCKANPGRFIDVRVTGTKEYDLIVEQI